jgi:GT2 family glycosyltransferase|tara:strand:- start:18279 stop:19226 length:948 start_codon:yes stop_codon:yes gene_type:complete
MFKVSIVIRAYNEAKNLPNLFYGIKQQTIKPDEIILVDSESADDTVNIARDHKCKILTISKQDFTFGRSLNLGCKKASSDIIVICSAHCFPKKKDWIEQLIAPFNWKKNIGMTYGKQRGLEQSNFSEKQLFHQLFPSIYPNKLEFFSNNANSAILKKVYDEVEFDETLTGCEDIDFSKKIAKRNYKTLYCPKATILHLHNETFGQIINRYYREMIALQKILPNFYIPRRSIFQYISNLGSDLTTMVRKKTFNFKTIEEILKFRTAMVLGILKARSKKEITCPKQFKEIYFNNNSNNNYNNNVKDENLTIHYKLFS